MYDRVFIRARRDGGDLEFMRMSMSEGASVSQRVFPLSPPFHIQPRSGHLIATSAGFPAGVLHNDSGALALFQSQVPVSEVYSN